MNVGFYLSYDIKITLKSHFLSKTRLFCHYVRNAVMDVRTFPENLQSTNGLSIVLHGPVWTFLNTYLLMSSADNLCKQFGF